MSKHMSKHTGDGKLRETTNVLEGARKLLSLRYSGIRLIRSQLSDVGHQMPRMWSLGTRCTVCRPGEHPVN